MDITNSYFVCQTLSWWLYMRRFQNLEMWESRSVRLSSQVYMIPGQFVQLPSSWCQVQLTAISLSRCSEVQHVSSCTDTISQQKKPFLPPSGCLLEILATAMRRTAFKREKERAIDQDPAQWEAVDVTAKCYRGGQLRRKFQISYLQSCLDEIQFSVC